MVDFRKSLLLLAAIALLLGSAVTASAQPAFTCVSNAGVPPIVRAEGLAEYVGDMILNCTGGAPTPLGATVPQVNVQIFLNTNITSWWYDNPTEAMLMIDDPPPAEQRLCTAGAAPCVITGTGVIGDPTTLAPGGVNYSRSGSTVRNIYQGRQTGHNTIVWLGVPIDPPGTIGTRIVRIVNVRANANMLGVSSTLIPTSIVMFISATGTQSIPINNPQQTVAWVLTGLTTSIRNRAGDGAATSDLTRLQCVNNNAGLSTDPNKAACLDALIRFTEEFASSFKGRGILTGTTGTLTTSDSITQNSPGTIYFTESGFAAPAVTDWPTGAGRATQGTRLIARFANVPAGVRVYVTTTHYRRTASNEARLITTAADGSGAYSETSSGGSSATVASSCTAPQFGTSDLAPTFTPVSHAEVAIVGGAGQAVWEVTAADPLSAGRLEFGIAFAWTANTSAGLPGLGTATVNGSFAPLSTVTTRSTTAPVPRFADTSVTRNVLILNSCVTNLLFPFVSNQAGFDTGAVISNTSKDPYGTAVQAGACKLNYYGETTGGGAAPAAQTSATVPAGSQLVWTLSSGGNLGIAATPGFQGYIIAQCAFQYGHGFAFISDLGAQRLAMGYLALILDGSIAARTSSVSETLGQ